MSRPNRRLGDRKPVGSSEIRWNLPQQSWKQRIRKEQPEVGLLQDVSVTGAGIVAPVNDRIGRGSLVPVAFGWVEGTVRVVRVEMHPDGVRAVYGVEWVSTDSPLAKAIHQTFLQGEQPAW